MSHTTVTYKGNIHQRLDLRWLSHAAGKFTSIDQINKHSLKVGNENVNVADLFDVSGKYPNESIVLENANEQMDYVGHALPTGIQFTVSGNCGHFVGADLAGGNIKVEGNVQNYAGCAMNKGLIEITGNSGDYIGGADTGSKKGMSGGTVLIHGNAGNFVGDSMRRGTIMIVGNLGDYCGSRMIAGTITNLGTIGKQVGVGMRRGTILLPHKPKDVISGFHDCGRHSLGYLTLLLHELRRHKSTFQSLHPMRRRIQRYMGDTAVGGQGEMLIWIG